VHVVLDLILLVAVVGFGSSVSRRLGVAEPLFLVAVGVGISYIPHVLEIKLTPDLVLFGLLPPLLYAASIRTSLVDFRANTKSVLLLAVGLVAVTSVVVGFVAWWAVPGISLAAAFALGGVVAPPDAVAATTVARRVGMPRRIVSILEGESLLNDATSLVALNTALAALSASVSPWRIGWEFVRAAGGGLVVGIVAAFVLIQIRKLIDDPVLDTSLSFAAPYVAFLPAEEIHASGVLSVVVAGLLLGHKSPTIQSASSRISENINWRTVQFLLENVVFLLIGLQVRSVVDAVRVEQPDWGKVISACLLVLAACVVIRMAYIATTVALFKIIHPASAWTWPEAVVVGWAGMRGVVTLAAVFLIPEDTPGRPLLVLAALVVVAGTLLVQGMSLPWLVRRMRLPAPDAAEDALQAAGLVNNAALAGLTVLSRAKVPDDPPEVIAELEDRAMRRANRMWEQLGRSQDEIEPPAAVYRRLRLLMLAAERESLIEARDSGKYDDEVLRFALQQIDVEESMLDRIEDASARVDDELRSREGHVAECEHLTDAPRQAVPTTPQGCAECLRDGTQWVHLRLCLTCGHVGCCDSSVGRHATGHFHETQHPVMRSFEPGEAWRWCYVHELLG
jgi:CPA1 family monovalent cation:H+ antiporter